MTENETEAAKPYVCSVCGRKFGRGEHLRRHAIAHANVKPFQCKFCKKRFARKYRLLSPKLTPGTFFIATMRAVRQQECSLPFPKSRRDGRAIGVKSSSLVALAGFPATDVNKPASRVTSALVQLVNFLGDRLPQMFLKTPLRQFRRRITNHPPPSPTFPLQLILSLARRDLSSTPWIGIFSFLLCNLPLLTCR